MTRGRRRGWVNPHPLSETCGLCDEPLGKEPKTKRSGRWIHKRCWTNEKGE